MIRQANETDLLGIMSIIGLVVPQMLNEGNDQWNEQYPTQADFLADIEHGELFVDVAEQEPLTVRAVACFNQEEPAEYKQVQWSRPGTATVIHRLAVHPDFRNQGIARSLFVLAEDIARKTGTAYIRSDTYSRNPRMNSLFMRMEYRQTGVIRFLGRRDEFNCYDKVLG